MKCSYVSPIFLLHRAINFDFQCFITLASSTFRILIQDERIPRRRLNILQERGSILLANLGGDCGDVKFVRRSAVWRSVRGVDAVILRRLAATTTTSRPTTAGFAASCRALAAEEEDEDDEEEDEDDNAHHERNESGGFPIMMLVVFT